MLFSGAYHASKTAAVVFSDQRIELAPFGITVVDLKAGYEVELPP